MWKLLKHLNFDILCVYKEFNIIVNENADLLVIRGASQIQYDEKKSTIVFMFLLSLPIGSINSKQLIIYKIIDYKR